MLIALFPLSVWDMFVDMFVEMLDEALETEGAMFTALSSSSNLKFPEARGGEAGSSLTRASWSLSVFPSKELATNVISRGLVPPP